MQARDIMCRKVISVTTTTTVGDAATLLASRGFTALPVLDGDGDLIGLVTEADILRTGSPTIRASTAPIRVASSARTKPRGHPRPPSVE